MKKKNFFPIAMALFVLTLVSCNSDAKNAANDQIAALTPSVNTAINPTVSPAVEFSDTGIVRLPNSQVCMVNNKFMNKDQIVVRIKNKTYYGCCEGCVKTLNENPASRAAIDPLTNKQVDKAIAYITAKPGTKDEVLYFISEANARKYFNNYFQQRQ